MLSLIKCIVLEEDNTSIEVNARPEYDKDDSAQQSRFYFHFPDTYSVRRFSPVRGFDDGGNDGIDFSRFRVTFRFSVLAGVPVNQTRQRLIQHWKV